MMPSYDPLDDVEAIAVAEMQRQEEEILELFDDASALLRHGLPANTTGKPYKISLTRKEIDAMYWLGTRYGHGLELGALFRNEYNGDDFHDAEEIEVHLSEAAGWQAKELIEEDSFLTGLENSFALKLWTLASTIV